MDKNKPIVNHLLQKNGILVAFNISKTLKTKEISKLYKKITNTEKYNTDDRKEMANKLLDNITTSLSDIPGIINPPKDDKEPIIEYNHSMSELVDASKVIIEMLLDSKYTPKECQFIINNVINSLCLDDPDYYDDLDDVDDIDEDTGYA